MYFDGETFVLGNLELDFTNSADYAILVRGSDTGDIIPLTVMIKGNNVIATLSFGTSVDGTDVRFLDTSDHDDRLTMEGYEFKGCIDGGRVNDSGETYVMSKKDVVLPPS